MKNTVSGFSLIELTIVLVIFGMLMSGLVSVISVHVGQEKINRTQQQLFEIKEALLGFAVREDRLPCPADNYEKGIEESSYCDLTAGYQEGYLPWANLGVGKYDAWGHPFRYRIEDGYYEGFIAKNSTRLRVRTMGKKGKDEFQLTNIGDSRAIAIIFSCGKNGRPDPTGPTPEGLPMEIDYSWSNDADGARNEHNKTCEITNDRKTARKEAGINDTEKVYIYDNNLDNIFDDQLTWLSRYTLITRLTRAGTEKWPPPP